MSSKNRPGGLGRGLGALIPSAPASTGTAGTVDASDTRAVEPADAAGTGTIRTDTAEADTAERAGGSPTGREPVGGPEFSGPENSGPAEVPGATFVELPVANIHANAKQPRQVFEEAALDELTHSIREFGVLQPVVVRPDGDAYELVMGERRLRAAVAAGLDVIPAIVRTTADDAMLRDALLENIHRVQLNPLEEAAAYQQLLDEFGSTHDELATRLGRSRPQVSNTIRLLQLSVPVQRRVAAGVLSAGHARALLGLEDPDAQDDIAARIVAEGLSVRATEELVTLAASGHAERKTTRKAPAPRVSAPALTELADKLSDVFETRVRVELGRRKGKITVEFASVDDLERIVATMAPQVSSGTTRPGQDPRAQEGPEPGA